MRLIENFKFSGVTIPGNGIDETWCAMKRSSSADKEREKERERETSTEMGTEFKNSQ